MDPNEISPFSIEKQQYAYTYVDICSHYIEDAFLHKNLLKNIGTSSNQRRKIDQIYFVLCID